MNEPTKKNRAEVLTWLGYVIASPIAALGMVMLLLGACSPLDLCPDLQCEYGYADVTGEAAAPSPDQGGKGDDGKGDRGHDKGKDGDDD